MRSLKRLRGFVVVAEEQSAATEEINGSLNSLTSNARELEEAVKFKVE